jgi:hypothetical protein
MRKKIKKSVTGLADSLNQVFVASKEKLSNNDLKQKAEKTEKGPELKFNFKVSFRNRIFFGH